MHVSSTRNYQQRNHEGQSGKVIVKFLWWPLIVSIVFSIFLTLLVNIIF